MRRSIALLLTACLAALALVGGGTSTSSAAAPVTGRLVDVTGTHPPVVGAKVQLRTVTEAGPGIVVASGVTDSTGAFSLDPGAADEVYVQVVRGLYQGGYVGGDSPAYVQPSADYGSTYGSGAIGKIFANPAFIRGTLVNPKTGNPVASVRVTARSDNNLSQFEGSDTTGPRGGFMVRGIECEDDCYLKFAGGPMGYENGFRDCNAHVVPTWGGACASPLGRIGKVFIQKV